MIHIIVFAPVDDLVQSSPRGFAFTDGYFSEARLKDPVSATHSNIVQLQRTLGYLQRRYPKRIKLSWVNPWSLNGLLFSLRYRIRSFPTVILQSQLKQVILSGDEITQISERVADLLSATPE
ncbi:MAG: hypothetical protein JSV61_09200 [Anaerolineales bacterium]|nr:MAG: hypothetical protein JSV61_09200 [Anaerolineales bacterium]